MKRRALMLGMAGAALASARARAAGEVAIGAIHPLTGLAASAGLDARVALETAADIVNTRHTPVAVRMGQGGGLPRLGGAVLRLVVGDSRDDPEQAAAEAERLIVQEGVVALLGGRSDASAAAVAEVAARHGRPFIAAGNPPEMLGMEAQRWVFRTAPPALMFAEATFACLHDIGARSGRAARSVSLFYEDSAFGIEGSMVQRRLAVAAGLELRADIRYRASSPGLASEALLLKAADADVLLPSSNTADAIMILRAMDGIGYRPRAIIAQAAGFQDPSFLAVSGARAEGVMSRASFALDATASRPAISVVNALFHARSGKDLNDETAREITALLVLADAIDRAGTVQPEALRAALAATLIAGAETIMPWRGVRFDANGQNVLCTPVVQQVSRGAYRTIWPFDLAVAGAAWAPNG
jgi:branched-chain amino acid transport system substrate-binding protein